MNFISCVEVTYRRATVTIIHSRFIQHFNRIHEDKAYTVLLYRAALLRYIVTRFIRTFAIVTVVLLARCMSH